VIVRSIRFCVRSWCTVSLRAIGSEPPSVMTCTMRASGLRCLTTTATIGSWLCRAHATTGIRSRLVGSSMPSSPAPVSTWRLV
jgi:hypothetical protein